MRCIRRIGKALGHALRGRIRMNLPITLATFAMSAAARLEFQGAADVSNLHAEIVPILAGGMIAAWIGAGSWSEFPRLKL